MKQYSLENTHRMQLIVIVRQYPLTIGKLFTIQ